MGIGNEKLVRNAQKEHNLTDHSFDESFKGGYLSNFNASNLTPHQVKNMV